MSEPTLYEAIYILDPSLSDEEAEALTASVEQAVTEAGGEVVGTRDFRTRRLAYRIRDYTHGTYKLLYFHGSGDVVNELKAEMAIREPLIRSRVFVANPRAVVGGSVDEEEEEAAARAEAAEAAAEEAGEAGAEEAEAEAVEEATAEEEAEEEAEASEASDADEDEDEGPEEADSEESAEPDADDTPQAEQ